MMSTKEFEEIINEFMPRTDEHLQQLECRLSYVEEQLTKQPESGIIEEH